MCPTCDGNQRLLSERTTLRAAFDEQRHSTLLQCGVCRQYFDFVEEARLAPWALDDEAARAAYPGAVPLVPGDDASGPRL